MGKLRRLKFKETAKKGEVIHGPMRLTMTSTIKGRANNSGLETVTGGTTSASTTITIKNQQRQQQQQQQQ